MQKQIKLPPSESIPRTGAFLAKHVLQIILPVAATGLFAVTAAQAAIITTGDVNTNASNWTSTTYPMIGITTTGTVAITNGSQITSGSATIAQGAGSNGTASIDGAGSKWTINNTAGFKVGTNGTGLLSVTNGGSLVVSPQSPATSMVGSGNGSNGTITIDGVGSTMNIGSNALNLGYYGNGTLNITNGGSFTGGGSGYNILLGAASNGSGSGTINVSGKNSKLTSNASALSVGFYGNGVLNITDGGTVIHTGNVVYLGQQVGSTGRAVVDGAGSTLTLSQNQGSFYASTLSVSNGGTVAAKNIYAGKVTIDIGTGSQINAKGGNGVSGTFTNNGTVRFGAGAGAASGTYTPITAGTWAGSGTYQALGGVWNGITHTVTVSAAIATTAGNSATMDLYTNQRGIVTDPATGKSVGMGFQATTTSTPISFGASAISGTKLSSLQGLLGAGKSVLSGWDFTAGGTTISSNNPVYLSLFAGDKTSLSGLTLWKYTDGSGWSQFSASDLAYGKTYASFTASDLASYAVTGSTPTPIPAAAWLFGSGLLGMVGIRRRKSPAAF